MARTAATHKPNVPRRPIPSKSTRPVINAPTIFTKKRDEAAKKKEEAARAKAQRAQRKKLCRREDCPGGGIEDGICMGCGTVIDDSNIVSEVQFGENSSGAAVVQGTYVSGDQGGARSSGPGLRGMGNEGEGREATIREGKRVMNQLAQQLQIPETTVTHGVQILKLAVMNNFIQGRRTERVCAVCLYTACRMTQPCRVMLIDFADKISPQCNVFKLGRTFKALHNAVTLNGGIYPVVPEDLIWRFASKLEFGHLIDKVAEDAVRMVQRMSVDWMVMGRRPSGVCGACLILAARMNNFRRTITEVVYIVKVTTHTVQKRLDEFKLTPSSNLTVDEFLNHEFLESAHDPPSFYQQTEEFKATKKKRKRKGHDAIIIEDNAPVEDEADQQEGPSKRQKPAAHDAELRRDADGFAIPPIPSHAQSTQQSSVQSAESNIDPALRGSPTEDTAQEEASLEEVTRQTLDDLAKDYANDSEEPGITSANPVAYSGRGRPATKQLQVRVSKAWENDERQLESEMSELVSDPNTLQHAVAYAEAERRISSYLLNPESQVCMDVHVGDDEFAGDPEVENMILSPEEALIKEKIWLNNNKDWLRLKQKKEFEKKLAEEGPPKAKRNRKKRPKIGEGHAPMDPADAAVQTMEKVKMTKSKKIDYQKLRGLFDGKRSTEGSAYGSSANSRAGSEFGSIADSVADTVSVRSQSVAASVASEAKQSRARSAIPEFEGSEMGDSDRGASVAPSEGAESTVQEDDWRKGMQPQTQGDDEDELPEDNEDYVDTGFGDDNDSIPDVEVPGGFDGPEDDYDE